MIPAYIILIDDEVAARIYETEKRTIVVLIGERLLLGKIRIYAVRNCVEIVDKTEIMESIIQVISDLLS